MVSMQKSHGNEMLKNIRGVLKVSLGKIILGGDAMETLITLKTERCKGCGICAAFCPKKVLAVSALGKIEIADGDSCIGCGQCELRCPDYAIFVDKEVTADE